MAAVVPQSCSTCFITLFQQEGDVRTPNTTGWWRFIHGAVLMVGLSLIVVGWKSSSRAAIAGPKGKFGVNGPETLSYLRGLDFSIASTGDSIVVKQYPCTVTPTACPAAGVRLMLIPEAAAAERDWESAMQANRAGHVVAMVVNVDGMTFPDLGLAPGERAYAWVGQTGTSATDRGFAIYKLNSSGITTYTWFLTKNVSHCDNNVPRSKPAIKTAHPPGGSPCVPLNSSTASQGMLASRMTTASTISTLVGGPLWISCSGGCCEVVPQ